MTYFTCLPKNPLYCKSISRLSSCNFIASRIESAVTSFESRTTFSSSCLVISGNLTASRIGVGSTLVFWFAHSRMALKISISGAQKESLEISSFTEDCREEKYILMLDKWMNLVQRNLFHASKICNIKNNILYTVLNFTNPQLTVHDFCCFNS